MDKTANIVLRFAPDVFSDYKYFILNGYFAVVDNSSNQTPTLASFRTGLFFLLVFTETTFALSFYCPKCGEKCPDFVCKTHNVNCTTNKEDTPFSPAVQSTPHLQAGRTKHHWFPSLANFENGVLSTEVMVGFASSVFYTYPIPIYSLSPSPQLSPGAFQESQLFETGNGQERISHEELQQYLALLNPGLRRYNARIRINLTRAYDSCLTIHLHHIDSVYTLWISPHHQALNFSDLGLVIEFLYELIHATFPVYIRAVSTTNPASSADDGESDTDPTSSADEGEPENINESHQSVE